MLSRQHRTSASASAVVGSSAFFTNAETRAVRYLKGLWMYERWRPKPAPYEVTPKQPWRGPHSLPPLD